MVRDNLLTTLARENGYYAKEIVKQQSQWWKEKITYSMVREELIQAIQINNDEVEGNSFELKPGVWKQGTKNFDKYVK